MTRNAVSNPILNNPFDPPTRHWEFGQAARIVEGRRPASYYGATRTDRGEVGAVASQEEAIALGLVNRVRERVNAWRVAGHPGVTHVTRDLLHHWNGGQDRPLFFCQREAVETIIWLTETSVAERQGIDVPLDVPQSAGLAALRRYCAKMATGSGKTVVMAMLAAWSILNKLASRQDPRFSEAVLVVGPNLTVKERLAVLLPQSAGNYYERFDLVPRGYLDTLSRGRVLVTNWHVFGVRDDSGKRQIVQRGKESPAAFASRILRRDLGDARNLLVMNDEAHHAWRPAPLTEEELTKQLEGLSAEERKEALAEVAEATIWVEGLDLINKARGVRLVVDLSATPFYIRGSGYPEGSPLPWVVCDFGLVDAIESGITKIPRIPVSDDSGRPDPKYFHLWRSIMERLPAHERDSAKKRAKPTAVWREAQGAAATLGESWGESYKHFDASGYSVPPVMIVVAANTDLAEVAESSLAKGEVLRAFGDDATFRIDSKVLAEAESAVDGESKEHVRELLRLKTATVGKDAWPGGRPPDEFPELSEPPGKNVRCVVSVGMLTEGWDAQNVTQILGLRAFSSQLLCEQVVGRGLRRMNYQVDPVTRQLEPEYCDVFGIPFEVIPVQANDPSKPNPIAPSTLVMALPERAHLRFEWPRVEGFVVHVERHLRCDVDKLPPVWVHPTEEPTEVAIGAQAGWVDQGKVGFNTISGEPTVLDRATFHGEHRLQRTEFEIAREITECLAAGKRFVGHSPEHAEALQSILPAGAETRRVDHARLLFPQVLAVVKRYVKRRLKLPEGKRPEDIGLGKYKGQIVSFILAGIEPDIDLGEEPILPRIDQERPTASTDGVQFRTTKKVKGTLKSHVSHVVLDSTWEDEVAHQFEVSRVVEAYVKNDRIDFSILYDWEGAIHRYFPDYLVRLRTDTPRPFTLIWEVKGLKMTQDRVKFEAASRWCRAMNHHGGYGRWMFVFTDSMGQVKSTLRDVLERLARNG